MTRLPTDVTFPLLMERLEALLDILHQHRISYWFDWGTLLGYHRHGNVIPWDYDVDMCFLKEDYDRLLDVFARAGGRIGKLSLDPTYYHEPVSASFIPLDEDPNRYHGIDLVAYTRGGGRVTTLMSPELIAMYPLDYNWPEEQVFPLRRGHFLGRRILIPNRGEDRLKHSYGDWRKYPDDQAESETCHPPWRELPRSWLSGKANNPEWITTTWVVLQEDLNRLHAAGVPLHMLDGLSFTGLVFLAERALWGRVYVGSLCDGETLDAPGGAWVKRL